MSLFFNYEEFILEEFQLENLLTSSVPFELYSLDNIESTPDKKIINLIKEKAKVLKDPIQSLEDNKVTKDCPIVFVCNKGKKSKKIIKKMSQLDYKNIFFVNGGLSALMNT